MKSWNTGKPALWLVAACVLCAAPVSGQNKTPAAQPAPRQPATVNRSMSVPSVPQAQRATGNINYGSAATDMSTQQALGQYRQIYNQADPSIRNQVISPDALQRMLNDPSSANAQPFVDMYRQQYNQISPAYRNGMITPDALQQMLRDEAVPDTPRTIGGDPNGPDFAAGAPDSAIDALGKLDAASPSTDLDSLRGDPSKQTPGCAPDAQSQLAALQAKAQNLRDGISAVDEGAAMVNAESGAGDKARSAANTVAVLQGVKAVSDAAVGLFGALGGAEGKELSDAYSVGQKLGSSFNAIQEQDAGKAAANFTSAMNEQVPGAALVGAFATDDPNEKAANTFEGTKSLTKAVGATGVSNVAGAASNLLTASKVLGDSNGTLNATQVAQVGGNVAQALGSTMTAIGTDGLKVGGGIYSSVGKVVTSVANYSDAVGKAFDTAADGNDEKARLDGMVSSNQQQIAARRAHLVDLLNQTQSQIDSLVGCASPRVP